MKGIPDLTLERALTTLNWVAEQKRDEFVSDMASITALLLTAPGERLTVLPKATQDRVLPDLHQSLDELAARPQPADERGRVFWAFFHAAVLRLAFDYFSETIGPTAAPLQRFLDQHMSKFTASDERPRVEYLGRGLTRDLLTEHFRALLENAQTALGDVAGKETAKLAQENEKAAGFFTRLQALEQRAGELEILIKGQVETLNFVGLSRAFGQMVASTKRELKAPRVAMYVVAALLMLPPLFSMWTFHRKVTEFWWQVSGPMLAIEVVLFYLFRVLLLRYQSLRAQLLQLELRFSVCAFVEGYAEFAGKTRKSADDKTLEKFEALVFSGITPDPQHVPSQFDGLEPLMKLLRTVKGKD